MASVELTREEKIDAIRSLLGFVKRLNGRRLPDDFNVTVRVRGRKLDRMEIEVVPMSSTFIEEGVVIKE